MDSMKVCPKCGGEMEVGFMSGSSILEAW